ncbi:MAG TPA: hypothetical protein VKT50_07710 [Candidatus Acidoferrales bacterium]|nr:hypothetical protein [Candidatus Acidoferrales bacterium]
MSGLKERPTPVKESLPSLGEKAEAIAAAWLEARLVYPLYFYLTNHFHLEIAPVHEPELPAACPASGLFDRIMKWLGEMDTRIRTNQLRQLLHSLKEIKPESLRALIMRLLRRAEKTSTDRDNVDLLLATYFALCAPEDLYSCEITLADVAQVLRSVIADADPTELEWCVPLNQVLDAMNQCHGLREVFAAKLLEKGRQLKDASGFMFYDPAALVAFTRFNFLLRRSFFRLLHADLRAIREGLSELERRGIVVVDCRSAGLAAEEPVGRLREISLAWRQPISSDYAAESANRTFEQLLAIRDAVERALGILPVDAKVPVTKSASSSGAEEPAIAEEPAVRQGSFVSTTAPASASHGEKLQHADVTPSVSVSSNSQVSTKSEIQTKSPPATAVVSPVVPTSTSAPRAEVPASREANRIKPQNPPASPAGNVPSPQLEECLERIWEQLIEAPPTRGRSMSTVTLGDARVLLSAWEVNAFVSDGGQLSEDLRRAVAARALVALAREEQKHSGSSAKLDAAVALGRDEMTYLQRRVDEAQRMKNTEAAVNLGISARRLLSAMEGTQN